jgi:AI-2 transport protein TqsA
VQTVCLLVLTFIASAVALYLLKPVLVPFVLALFFTYCLQPVIDLQIRYLRAPRVLAVIGASIFGLAVLALAGFIVAAAISKMSDNFSDYQKQFDRFTEHVASYVPLESLGFKPGESGRWFTPSEQAITGLVATIFNEARVVVSNGALVAIFMIFILIGSKRRPPNRLPLLVEIESRVQRYITQMMFFSTMMGVVVGLVLWLCGVKFAGMFGFMAFLLNFIPNIGGIIATVLPLPIILLSPEMSIVAKVMAVALPAALQFIMGNLIQPRFQGSALDLNPVILLMALIFFGMIWGIVGAFLAVPITAVIRIVLEKVPATRPVAELLAGRLDAFATAAPRS